MEKQYQHTINGQGVYQSDLNLMGESGALADDRVFAEMLRMDPDDSSVARGVMGTTYSPTGGTDRAIVVPGTGKVKIRPFRAFIASRTSVSSDAKEHWRGIRSGLCIGSSAIEQELTIDTLNASGTFAARWDLVYAIVTPDVSTNYASRKVKAPTAAGTITSPSVSTTKETTVTVAILKGSADGSLPVQVDGSGYYCIPLAYIRVQASFTSSVVLTTANIWDVAPVLTLSEATGVSSCQPASINCWKCTDGIAGETFSLDPAADFPRMYLAPSMVGAQQRIIALDFDKVSSGGVVDESMDWRNRVFQVDVTVNTGKFPWSKDRSGGGGTAVVFGGQINSTQFRIGTEGGDKHTSVLSHSFQTAETGKYYVIKTNLSALTNQFVLYVDESTGKLHVQYSADPGQDAFIWINASGQFANRIPSAN